MKALLALVLLGAILYLWQDDRSKREALDQVNDQLQQVTTDRDQLRMQLAHPAQNVATQPNWFQQRLNESPKLLSEPEPSRGH